MTQYLVAYNTDKEFVVKFDDAEIELVVGIYVLAKSESLFDFAIQGFAHKLPFTIAMPCGHSFTVTDTDSFVAGVDVPCPCGDARHWLVKYKIDETLDRREVESD